MNLIWFQLKWENLAVVLILGLLWFAGLFIYKTGQKLTKENIDIYRLEGRFKNLRKTVYKLVAAVPLIGRKKKRSSPELRLHEDRQRYVWLPGQMALAR
jgi:hypothetical protein